MTAVTTAAKIPATTNKTTPASSNRTCSASSIPAPINTIPLIINAGHRDRQFILRNPTRYPTRWLAWRRQVPTVARGQELRQRYSIYWQSECPIIAEMSPYASGSGCHLPSSQHDSTALSVVPGIVRWIESFGPRTGACALPRKPSRFGTFHRSNTRNKDHRSVSRLSLKVLDYDIGGIDRSSRAGVLRSLYQREPVDAGNRHRPYSPGSGGPTGTGRLGGPGCRVPHLPGP